MVALILVWWPGYVRLAESKALSIREEPFIEAARVAGLKRVVWASSETILGLPFDAEPPAYAPVDEDHPPLPQSSYAASKLLGEELARQVSRRSGIPIVGLRFSNIMGGADYARFPSYWDDARLRKWNLWSYVDGRDVALACRLGLEAPLEAVGDLVDDIGAFGHGARRPLALVERLTRRCNRFGYVVDGSGAYPRNLLLGERVDDVDPFVAGRVDPATADEHLLAVGDRRDRRCRGFGGGHA